MSTTKQQWQHRQAGEKRCNGCRRVLPLTEFYPKAKTELRPSGYSHLCRACDLAKQRERRQRR